jgi:hypothetical protein
MRASLKLPRKGLYFVAMPGSGELAGALRTLADMLENGDLKHHTGCLQVCARTPEGAIALEPGTADRFTVVSTLTLTYTGGNRG